MNYLLKAGAACWSNWNGKELLRAAEAYERPVARRVPPNVCQLLCTDECQPDTGATAHCILTVLLSTGKHSGSANPLTVIKSPFDMETPFSVLQDFRRAVNVSLLHFSIRCCFLTYEA